MSADRAKESRPARAWIFGKRDTPMKTMVDAETRELAARKARLLGYHTLAEWQADVITANVRGVDMLAMLQADRLRRAVTIGPVLDEEPGDGAS